MVLFFSDMHLGRGPASADRREERDLVACLQAQFEATSHLYLLGDVFEAFIEHRAYVQKNRMRLYAEMARWTSSSRPVTYLLGNHDPWHIDFMDHELGVRVIDGAWRARHYGQPLHLIHGDTVASTHGVLGQWMRAAMRDPRAVAAYRTLLPADWGLALAEWASRALHGPPDPEVVQSLRAYAKHMLTSAPVSAVLMGHSHIPELTQWEAGTYLNTGNWYEKRTFVRLTHDRWHLMHWNGTDAIPIKTAPVSSPAETGT